MVAHEDSRVMKEGQQEEVERCATTWKNSPYMASITRRAKEIHISAPALSTSNYLCCCLTCSLPKEHTKMFSQSECKRKTTKDHPTEANRVHNNSIQWSRLTPRALTHQNLERT